MLYGESSVGNPWRLAIKRVARKMSAEEIMKRAVRGLSPQVHTHQIYIIDYSLSAYEWRKSRTSGVRSSFEIRMNGRSSK